MPEFRNRKIFKGRWPFKIEGKFVLLAILIGIVLLIALISMIFGFRLFAFNPRIDAVSQVLVSPGDTIEITGSHFGKTGEFGKIMLDTHSVPRNEVTDWSKKSITLVVPEFSKSGFLYVKTRDGESNGILILNREHFPQLSAQAFLPGRPYISYIEPENPKVGESVTLIGMNFRDNPVSPGVLITKEENYELPFGEEPNRDKMISLDKSAYQFYSDSKIIFTLPEQAQTGPLVVMTGKGSSNPYNLEVNHSGGSFKLSSPRTYSFRQKAEIYNVGALEPNSLYLWFPNPVEDFRQTGSSTLESSLPVLKETGNLSLLRKDSLISGVTETIERTISVTVNNLEIEIDPEEILPYRVNGKIYSNYTRSTDLIPSNIDAVRYEAIGAAQGYTSPYGKSRMIYSYLCKKFSVVPLDENVSLTEMYQRGEADSKSVVFLSCALLRAGGIPCRPVSGVVVKDGKCLEKFWLEIFYRGVGWVPADIVSEIADTAENGGYVRYRYFGVLGNDHIAFSKGIAEPFRMQPDGRLGKNTPHYSLQSFAEESSGNISSFRSRWYDLTLSGN